MAKTLMIKNEVYGELKKFKGNNKSFSELLKELIEAKASLKTGKSLKRFFGILKSDKEYDKVIKALDKKWKKWDKMYA